jgi:hypothetical protein
MGGPHESNREPDRARRLLRLPCPGRSGRTARLLRQPEPVLFPKKAQPYGADMTTWGERAAAWIVSQPFAGNPGPLEQLAAGKLDVPRSFGESHPAELRHHREVVGNDFDRAYVAVTDHEDLDDANLKRASSRGKRSQRRLERARMEATLKEHEHETITALDLLDRLDLQFAERSLQHPRPRHKLCEGNVRPVNPNRIRVRLAEGGKRLRLRSERLRPQTRQLRDQLDLLRIEPADAAASARDVRTSSDPRL